MANRWLETEALSPAALEELNPTNSHVHLQGDPSPLNPSNKTPTLADTLHLVRGPVAKDPAKPRLEP